MDSSENNKKRIIDRGDIERLITPLIEPMTWVELGVMDILFIAMEVISDHAFIWVNNYVWISFLIGSFVAWLISLFVYKKLKPVKALLVELAGFVIVTAVLGTLSAVLA